MWKLAVGFAVFAAISLFVIFQAGDKVDMSGESTGPRPLPRRCGLRRQALTDLAQAERPERLPGPGSGARLVYVPARRFRLTRYFTLTSLAAFAVLGAALSFLQRGEEIFRRAQREQVEFVAKVQAELLQEQRDTTRQPGRSARAHRPDAGVRQRLVVFPLAPLVAQAKSVPIEPCRPPAEVRGRRGAALEEARRPASPGSAARSAHCLRSRAWTRRCARSWAAPRCSRSRSTTCAGSPCIRPSSPRWARTRRTTPAGFRPWRASRPAAGAPQPVQRLRGHGPRPRPDPELHPRAGARRRHRGGLRDLFGRDAAAAATGRRCVRTAATGARNQERLQKGSAARQQEVESDSSASWRPSSACWC